MVAHSYLELATTLAGWHIAIGISEFLTSTGLVFLPFGVALLRNWREPTRTQQANFAAPISLRQMEQDVGISLIVIIFFFLPAVPVTVGDITYKTRTLENTVSAGTPDVPYVDYINNPKSISVPVMWWLVHQVSSYSTQVIVDRIDGLSDPAVFRAALTQASRVRITDEILVNEFRTFRRNCYEPSLAKFQKQGEVSGSSNGESEVDVDWIGSKLFLNSPGYYKQCGNVTSCGTSYHAQTVISPWRNVNSSLTFKQGQPNCDAWWVHPRLGLRARLLKAMEKDTPHLYDSIEKIRHRQNLKFSVEEYEDRYLRRAINYSPWLMVDRADRGTQFHRGSLKQFFSIDGIQQLIATIGSLGVSAVVHIVMEFVVIGLPMLQAIALMLVYIAIPFVVPYAVLAPSILVRVILTIFSLKFLTALWAVAEFLDEKLLSEMYPNPVIFEFGGGGSTADVVLGLITLTAYITLPIAWFLLIGYVSSTPISYIGGGLIHLTNRLTGTSTASTSGVRNVAKNTLK